MASPLTVSRSRVCASPATVNAMPSVAGVCSDRFCRVLVRNQTRFSPVRCQLV